MSFIDDLKKHGVDPSKLDALATYGGRGNLHTKKYVRYVRSLDVWEINPEHKSSLHKNLPAANIKITDSYEEIKSTSKTYDLVVIDNPMSTRGFPGQVGKCEHFDLFPDVFRVGRDNLILVMNVIPRKIRARWRYIFNHQHLDRRAEFYNTLTPENVRISDMVETYSNMAEEFGYRLTWWSARPRAHGAMVYYMILDFRR